MYGSVPDTVLCRVVCRVCRVVCACVAVDSLGGRTHHAGAADQPRHSRHL
jgi:hypothetical protein